MTPENTYVVLRTCLSGLEVFDSNCGEGHLKDVASTIAVDAATEDNANVYYVAWLSLKTNNRLVHLVNV